MNRPLRLKCYYCVCTACARVLCPWKHKLFKECWVCQERAEKLPRLDCDYFRHYLKYKRFRFRKCPRSELRQSGTFLLRTDYGTFKGSYNDLVKLRSKLGGCIQPYDILEIGDSDDS